ncbi:MULTISPECIES: hypothetical protein [unclassified Brevundimonas]|uniref:hypothetical protein n=1 Tax=unclassified Brevundimonas TaxID=2622653 RepID=UPI0025BE9F5B|nr:MULTISPECIES: hypothetical protein [unclassified Brevundimonas]
MPAAIRTATLPDVPSMVELLIQDAGRRHAHDAALWALAADAREKIEEAVTFALTAEKQPFRQDWLVAEADGKLVGIVHSLLLPVPPIYAGERGESGLLMPETFAAQDAPPGTSEALIEAAEADLKPILGQRARTFCWHRSSAATTGTRRSGGGATNL